MFENYDEIGLRLGGKYFPNNRKILNETNDAIWRDYRGEGKYMAFNMQLKEFVAKGLPIDEIGLQYHIMTTSEEMGRWEVYDTFLDIELMTEGLNVLGEYEFPMHISEITVKDEKGEKTFEVKFHEDNATVEL